MAEKRIVQYLEREVTEADGHTTHLSYDERQVTEYSTRQWTIKMSDGTCIVYSVVDVDLSDPEHHPFLRKAGTGSIYYPEVCVLCNKGPGHYFHRRG